MINTNIKLFFTLILFSINYSQLSAQVPRFQKYPVMESGASLYLPAETTFDLSYSEDTSEVYTCQVEFGNATYGAIIVKIAEPLSDDPEEWEELLWSYMQFLNSSAFMLTSTIDPGYGHTLESHPPARGILMYGEDDDELQYTIKGWVDNNFIAILYLSSTEEININFQNLFLNGFRFPSN